MKSTWRRIMTLATCAAFMVTGTAFAAPQWSETIKNGSILGNNIFNFTTGKVNGIANTSVLFTPGVDLVTAADVRITAVGIGDYTVNIEGINHPDNFVFLLGSDTFNFTVSGVASLNTDGIVTVNFSEVDDWVKLCSVTAEAWGIDNPAPVPEPESMLLLGAGLFALAVYRKRRMAA